MKNNRRGLQLLCVTNTFFSLAELNHAIKEKLKIYNAHEFHRFCKWAEKIGNNTFKVIDAILISSRIEQQNYRSCMGLLKLADKYSPEQLETSCQKVLSYTAHPSYKSILTTGRNRSQPVSPKAKSTQNNHGIIRGASYYGGKR